MIFSHLSFLVKLCLSSRNKKANEEQYRQNSNRYCKYNGKFTQKSFQSMGFVFAVERFTLSGNGVNAVASARLNDNGYDKRKTHKRDDNCQNYSYDGE